MITLLVCFRLLEFALQGLLRHECSGEQRGDRRDANWTLVGHSIRQFDTLPVPDLQTENLRTGTVRVNAITVVLVPEPDRVP